MTLELIGWILALLVSFPILHFVTENYFIPSLDEISKKLRMSSDIAGSTLMAAGSSTPELAFVLFAIFTPGEHYSLGIGTIVGSALFNLLVIVGLVILVYQTSIKWQPISRDLLFYAISIILLIVFYMDGKLTMPEALILVLVYVLYIFVMYNWRRFFPYQDKELSKEIGTSTPSGKSDKKASKAGLFEKSEQWLSALDKVIRKAFPWISNLYASFIFSIVCITLLSYLLLQSAVNVSLFSGIDEVYIGLIIIAIGTSVPDLFSSVIVAQKGRPGMAINNAIGSNVFDILMGIGLPFLLLTIMIDQSIQVDRSDLVESLFWLFGSLVVLTLAFIITKWRLIKGTGYLLIVFYLVYIVWEIAKAATASLN
jgi:K+-dependent Na+/Ca+ exchanger-like protein